MPSKQKHKNHLVLIRKKNASGQKQIAALLGNKTTDQISRYERGVKLSSLKTALKLQIIYHVPVHILFYGYYEVCLKEIKKQRAIHNQPDKDFISLNDDLFSGAEFCTFIERLKQIEVKSEDLDKARSHITELINARSKKMNHS